MLGNIEAGLQFYLKEALVSMIIPCLMLLLGMFLFSIYLTVVIVNHAAKEVIDSVSAIFDAVIRGFACAYIQEAYVQAALLAKH